MSAAAGFGDGLTDKEELGILLQIFKKQIFQLLRQGSIVTVNAIPIKFLHERLRFCQMNTCYFLEAINVNNRGLYSLLIGGIKRKKCHMIKVK